MADEHDFSGGERGRFHRPGIRMNVPVYLDEEVLRYLRELAEAKGVSLSDVVNDLLRRDIDLARALKV